MDPPLQEVWGELQEERQSGPSEALRGKVLVRLLDSSTHDKTNAGCGRSGEERKRLRQTLLFGNFFQK